MACVSTERREWAKPVDAWYTGFAQKDDKRLYFCIYLGESPGAEVTSARAREIAAEIVSAAFLSPYSTS